MILLIVAEREKSTQLELIPRLCRPLSSFMTTICVVLVFEMQGMWHFMLYIFTLIRLMQPHVRRLFRYAPYHSIA